MEKRLTTLRSTAATVGLSIAAAAGTLFGFAKFTANAGEEAQKLSQKLGIEIERFQGLAFAAHLADVDAHQFAVSIRFLNQNLAEAAQGNREALASLGELGLGFLAAQTGANRTDKALSAIADRFAKLPDGPEKTRIAMSLFGRAGSDMIPLLNKGSEGIDRLAARARVLGRVFDKEAAAQAAHFNDVWKETLFALQGVRNEVGIQLLPTMTPFLEGLRDWIAANRQLVAQNLRSVLIGLGIFLKVILATIKQLFVSTKGFIDALGGVENVAIGLAAAFGIFLSGKLLYAIGGVVQGLFQLTKGIALAKLVAFGELALIGAVVVAIGLAIEDVIAFFQGRNSITGILVEQFRAFFAYLAAEFPNVTKFLVGAFQLWLSWVNLLIRGWKLLYTTLFRVGSYIVGVLGPVVKGLIGVLSSPLSAAGSVFEKFLGPAMGQLGQFMSDLSQGEFKVAFQNAAHSINSGREPLAAFAPSGVPIPAPAAASSRQEQNFSVSAPITVTVPAGTPPERVAPAVERGVSTGIEGLLRGAQRSFKGGVAY